MSSPYPSSSNTQIEYSDSGISSEFPGMSYRGTEAAALYYEDREINGVMYRVQNATYNKFAGSWTLVNTALPAYAWEFGTNGTISTLSSPAGTTPFTTWTNTGAFTAFPYVNVKAFGAKGDGVTDDTAAVQRAASALIPGGTLYFPNSSGAYILTPNAANNNNGYPGGPYGECWAVSIPVFPVRIAGESRDGSIIKCASNGFVANNANVFISMLFGIQSFTTQGAIELATLTFDGNSQNQTWGTLAAHNKFLPFFAVGNHEATGAGSSLVVRDVVFRNWSMQAYANYDAQGRGIETFGFESTFVSDSEFILCDTPLWLTRVFATDYVEFFVNNVKIVNPQRSAVYLESCGNLTMTNVQAQADAVTSPTLSGDGLRVSGPGSGSVIENILVTNCRFTNLQFPLAVGYGYGGTVKDSVFSHISAVGCGGGFQLDITDSSCVNTGLISDGCVGTVKWSGFTVYGSHVLNDAGAMDKVRLYNSVSVNSTPNGFVVGGEFEIIGGSVKGNSGSAIGYVNGTAWPSQPANGVIRGVDGLNPGGLLANQPALPASGVAYVNNTNYDCTVFVDGGTVSAIEIGAQNIGPVPSTLRVPAGQSVALTYSAAPTWKWFAD